MTLTFPLFTERDESCGSMDILSIGSDDERLQVYLSHYVEEPGYAPEIRVTIAGEGNSGPDTIGIDMDARAAREVAASLNRAADLLDEGWSAEKVKTE